MKRIRGWLAATFTARTLVTIVALVMLWVGISGLSVSAAWIVVGTLAFLVAVPARELIA